LRKLSLPLQQFKQIHINVHYCADVCVL